MEHSRLSIIKETVMYQLILSRLWWTGRKEFAKHGNNQGVKARIVKIIIMKWNEYNIIINWKKINIKWNGWFGWNLELREAERNTD